jgi:hypothetical protein
MSSLVDFPNDMLKELYDKMDFATHLCFAGTCKKFHRFSEIILPRDPKFYNKKWAFLLTRVSDPRIWKTEGWLSFDTFAKNYDELFHAFERTGKTIDKFMKMYRKMFKVFHGHIWNIRLYGPAPDK